jgi:hypothetical protein
MAASGRCNCGLAPEFLVGPADWAAVSDDHLPFEHARKLIETPDDTL